MPDKIVLLEDVDGGITVGTFQRSFHYDEKNPVEFYKAKEYYHSLRDAIRDLYDVDIDE